MPKLTSTTIIYKPAPRFSLSKTRSKVSGYIKIIKTLVRR